MKGQAYINEKDMFTTWGATLAKGAYEALLKPAPNKELIQNKSRLSPGKIVITNKDICKTDERDVTLSIWIHGESQKDYLTKYKSFLDEITSGEILLKIPILDMTFKLTYSNCSSYGEYGLTKGKLTLKLNEPNPQNREVTV